MALKGIMIEKDLDSFLNEHPEITATRDGEKVLGVSPTNPEDDITITSLYIFSGILLELNYIYKDKYFHYSHV